MIGCCFDLHAEIMYKIKVRNIFRATYVEKCDINILKNFASITKLENSSYRNLEALDGALEFMAYRIILLNVGNFLTISALVR